MYACVDACVCVCSCGRRTQLRQSMRFVTAHLKCRALGTERPASTSITHIHTCLHVVVACNTWSCDRSARLPCRSCLPAATTFAASSFHSKIKSGAQSICVSVGDLLLLACGCWLLVVWVGNLSLNGTFAA